MAEAGGRRGGSRALVTVASALFSALLHGSVLAAAILWIDHTPGAVTLPTEAISIELLETEVLEAVAASPVLEAAASPASVQSDPGEMTKSAGAKPTRELQPVAHAEQVTVKEATAAEIKAITPKGLDILQGAHDGDEAAGAEHQPPAPAVRTSETPSRETKKQPVKTAKLADPSETRSTESRQRKKGTAQSRATRGSAGSTGRVSASAGSAINYAALVRARVAARKPAGGGRRGTVVVAFGVTRSGGLSFASIARSSGDAGLDRSVLSAVRGAGPFPAPPPGAGLRFAIPFHFK